MKKLLALAMAAMMCAVAAPIHAAEEATEVNPQTDENQNIYRRSLIDCDRILVFMWCLKL